MSKPSSSAAAREPAFVPALLLLTLVYGASAYLGLNWAMVAGAGSPVWPASGVALAGLLIGGVRLWPAILIGRLGAALLSGSAQPLWADVSIASVNALGSVLPVLLIHRMGGIDRSLPTLPDLLKYVGWGALVGALISASLGTLTLIVSSDLSAGRAAVTFTNWSVGSFVGAITLGPLILAWTSRKLERWPPLVWLHLALILAAMALASWLVFLWEGGAMLRTWHLYPVLIWGALAFHVRGASAAVIIMSVIASWATSRGLGPIAEISAGAVYKIPLLQQYIASSTLTILLLAVVADERRGKEATAREAKRAAAAEERLRAVVEQMPVGVSVAAVPSGDFVIFNSRAGDILGHPLLGVENVDGYARYGALHADGTPYKPEEYPLARTVLCEETVDREPMIYRRGDGELVDLEVSAAPIFDSEGRAVLAVSSFEDVTYRKKADSALRESEERVRRVLDQLFAFVGVTTLDGILIETNRAPLDAAGIKAEDTFGKPFWETYWWSYSSEVQQQLKQAMVRAASGEAVRYEVKVRMAKGTLVTIDFQVAPLRDADGRITHLIPSAVVIDERIKVEAERRRLASILEATPDFVGTADADGRTLYLNPAARRMAGLSPDEPVADLPIASYAPPEVATRLKEVALPSAAANGIWEGEALLNLAGSNPVPVSQVVIAHRGSNGQVEFYSTIARDLSERKQAEEREILLAREVDHRSKNLLGVVQSIIHLAQADEVSAFKAALTGRIQSLARTHSLLAATRWEGADLQKLVSDELAPYATADGSHVRIKGSAVRLKPAAAQALALVVHELSTNAAKYGSLSVAGGELGVSWTLPAEVADGDRLLIRWEERSGPAVQSPTRRGFGSTVLRSSIERQLKGAVSLDWAEAGLVCSMSLPVEHVIAATPLEETTPAPAGCLPTGTTGRRLAGRRVLVLEDEALIAMQIEAAVADAGCTVIGPAARVGEAFDMIDGSDIDAALLDVNVADERSFPVADLLASKGVPFAFCTGYAGAASLPPRFADTVVVVKPFTPAEIQQAVERLLKDCLRLRRDDTQSRPVEQTL